MKVVIAPNAFKGTLTAPQAASAIARGVREVFPEAEIVEIPVADGGDGTMEARVPASRGEYRRARVEGPLADPVEARFGLIDSGSTAVVELATASGLILIPPALRDPRRASTYGLGQLLQAPLAPRPAVAELAPPSGLILIPPERRDPRRASTYGFGQLLQAALDAGPSRVIAGIGGSATNDGGAGMAQALGYRLLDAAGRELERGGGALARLERIDTYSVDRRWRGVRVKVACDVTNPLTGPEGASAVYGPQKGADPEAVRELDGALARLAAVVER